VTEHSKRALIVFEDGKPENERTARAIAERLVDAGLEARVASAAEAVVPDILAAEIYFFGAESPAAPSYGDLALAFKGLNLAGRRAAYFGGSGAAVAWLKTMCEDTEVTAALADLVGRRPEPAAVSAWLKGVLPGA